MAPSALVGPPRDILLIPRCAQEVATLRSDQHSEIPIMLIFTSGLTIPCRPALPCNGLLFDMWSKFSDSAMICHPVAFYGFSCSSTSNANISSYHELASYTHSLTLNSFHIAYLGLTSRAM